MELIHYEDAPKHFNSTKTKFPALNRNWVHSINTLKKLNKALSKEFNSKEFTVAVAGSYGRLDAGADVSDFDYLVLAEKKLKNLSSIHKRIAEIAKAQGLPLPNATGVFSEPTVIDELLEKAGAREDDLYWLGKRLLLLMECKPIYNATLFHSAQDRILRKYLEHPISDPQKEAIFLLNDTMRYFRGICVNYEYNFWKKEEKWVIRYVKLIHSRVIMYAGLLFLTMNSSKAPHAEKKFDYIRSCIQLTPIEKLMHVYRDNQDYSFDHLLGIYNIFLDKLSDPSMREKLKCDFADRHLNPLYSELHVTGNALRKELMRFLLSRRGSWSDNMIEYLVF